MADNKLMTEEVRVIVETSSDKRFQEYVYTALLDAEREEKSSDLKFSPEQALAAMHRVIEGLLLR